MCPGGKGRQQGKSDWRMMPDADRLREQRRRGRRGRRRWEEVGISHSVAVNWNIITRVSASLALL